MYIQCNFQQVSSTASVVRLCISGLASLTLLMGCTTTKNFNNALTEPAVISAKAAEVVAAAASDVLRANVLGLVESSPESPIELVCATQEGLRSTTINLRQFSEALEAVGKVAAKPDNVSFTGYISQIRKNKEAIETSGGAPNIEQQLAAKSRVDEYNRCKILFAADWSASPKLSSDGSMQVHGFTPTLGVILAFRDVALALLKYGEAAQREQAIKATVAVLLPQLEQSVQKLAAPVDANTFGSRVVYATITPGAPALAQEMNKTNLGASVSIQRWMTAMRIKANWNALGPCRMGQPMNACLGNADARANAEDFTAQISNYRNLAKINDQKILKALGDAVRKARAASDQQASLSDIFDALFTIGDAVSDIADKVDAAKQATN